MVRCRVGIWLGSLALQPVTHMPVCPLSTDLDKDREMSAKKFQRHRKGEPSLRDSRGVTDIRDANALLTDSSKDSRTLSNTVRKSPARARCSTGRARSLTTGSRDNGLRNLWRLVVSS